MTDANDLRRLALALEGTIEAPHFDRAAFKVSRIYVTLAADGQTANFKFRPYEQNLKCTVAPDAFAPVPNAFGEQGWTTATLAKLSLPELQAALEMAHEHALPGRKGGEEMMGRASFRPALILRSAKGASRRIGGGLVLRDAVLCTAPQDEADQGHSTHFARGAKRPRNIGIRECSSSRATA